MEKINLYSSNGQLGNISAAEKADLALKAGLSVSALTAIGNKAEKGELRDDPQGNLVSINYDPKTNSYSSTIIVKKVKTATETSGTVVLGGTEYPKEFASYYNSFVKPSLAVMPGTAGPSQPETPAEIRTAYETWKAGVASDKANGKPAHSTSAEDLSADITALNQLRKDDPTKTGYDMYNALITDYPTMIDKIQQYMDEAGISYSPPKK
jgi:hypothetical protein